jgi:hypothetical protein
MVACPFTAYPDNYGLIRRTIFRRVRGRASRPDEWRNIGDVVYMSS